MSSITNLPKSYKKKYKCPYCESRLERNKLPDHIEKHHKELIPQDYTATRVAFNTINHKTVGSCIICGKETDWNETKKRYERLCNNPRCKQAYIEMTEERLKKSRGITKSEMLSDPEFQNKMLKNRSISGSYKFSDGGKTDYVGSYEKNFLEFMDKFLKVESKDIQSPGPTIEYYYEGKKHFWITDFYYIPYNIVLDIKDGGKNPNTREMPSYRAKQYAKEKAIKDGKMYNYIRLTDNQFDQLLEMMFELKDGLMELEVVSKEEDGLTCVVISGGVLLDRKGVNVPGVKLNVPFISDQDREDIIYACQHDGDYLALSFVDEKEDVLQVREILKEQNREDMLIISKIESETAIDHIDDIIEVSDGIMVARGDLGVEVPVVNLPIYQKTIVEKCRAKGKFCIVATEMLSSMQKSARPTRAEVSDIANAVIDGTDAVMLSGETTTGKHPVEAVTYMANVCENTEKYLQYQDRIQTSFSLDVPATIAKGVVEITNDIDIEAIITATMTGYTARNISNLRPNTMIIAACPEESVARKLALNFGVSATIVDLSGSTDEIIEKCIHQAKKQFQLKDNAYVVVTGGFPNDTKKHHTNYLKIEMI